ncbi:hypothetical protein GCM10027445_63130 [Amycolatopsis endophytica]
MRDGEPVATVRLATARDNAALRGYYERAGYHHVADPPDAKWPTSLDERAVVHERTTPQLPT